MATNETTQDTAAQKDARQQATNGLKKRAENLIRQKSNIGRKIATGAIAGIVAFEGGGMAYTELNNNEPVSAHTLQVDAMHPWNIGLENITVSANYDPTAEVNFIKAGVNAVPATPEEIKNFLNQTPPVLERPKAGENAPTIRIIIPFSPENAKAVTIRNEFVERNSNFVPIVKVNGENIPFYIPLIEGAEKVDVKTSVNGNTIVGIDFLYYLNNGQTIRMWIGGFTSKNFIPKDTLKDVPAYDYSRLGNTVPNPDILPAKEFILNNDSLIRLFDISGPAELGLNFDSSNVGGLTPLFLTRDGKVLYSSSGN